MIKHCNLLLAILIGLGLFTACKPNYLGADEQNTSSPSDISLYDFLLTTEEMPDGWVGYEPFKSPNSLCYVDCASIQFDAQTTNQSRATHDVYIYESAKEAKRSYEIQLQPTLIGEIPIDWNYESEFADQSDFVCYTYKDMSYPVCEWTARYDRYIVDFYTWLVPKKMTLDDLEEIIRVIDRKMLTVKINIQE